ncbi:bacteriochlorophyll 4-vinyl reductase [Rhodospirillum rubrum F11]|uniref:Bacteriochlorophyll 4-vinyl reductase n=3 Tax=Rhodospirillum rubrum TaxID=1085 RepID=Q2RWS8_RHORT|nr:bacteriochlorophyll 4-vinyl reductase [Rhodospirillum rubrum]ABC21417.1 Bacteriochlorophyll 4-vinyl reductase [Rhodospirillum rubrum ATCC 11170]AEO47099.1 bacteriochlorophyll 4-vinyl reductase [Rhodospirillum rubrum F11]QXG81096.1 bacteriochlorophyll 4-vinyl reductase [Rhodospirillum rubrum]
MDPSPSATPIPPHGRIGPNAIIRVIDALRTTIGETACARIVEEAGLATYLDQPPQAMVDETEVARLHGALRANLDRETAEAVCRDAGEATAGYLLANRIPAAAQSVIKLLPPGLGSRALLAGIGRHAWTFAGSGQFTIRHGTPLVLSIAHCPLCHALAGHAPACSYYAATFEGLYRVLISPHARVREIACQAAGAPACQFAVTWTRAASAP